MAIFGIGFVKNAEPALPLVEALAEKGTSLRVREVQKLEQARNLLDLAAQEKADAALAAKHAVAVEDAYKILDNAGVTL